MGSSCYFDFRLLSRRDMEVAIEHGTPFLFRNSDDSATRLRSFLSSGNMNVSISLFPCI